MNTNVLLVGLKGKKYCFTFFMRNMSQNLPESCDLDHFQVLACLLTLSKYPFQSCPVLIIVLEEALYIGSVF